MPDQNESSFGENEILSLKKSHTIQLLLGVSDKNTIDHPWWVLTNDQAKSLIGRSIPAYTRIVQDSPEDYEKEIQNTQVVKNRQSEPKALGEK